MFDRLREKAHGRDEKRASLDGYQQQPEPAPAPAYASASSYQSPPPFQTRFASMSMHASDDLRFLHFPPQVIDQCRTAILRVWKGGIQREGMYGNSQEFKLSGYPWSAMGSDAMDARRLIATLLGTLHSLGWILTLNTDVSKNVNDKDTLLFRYQSPAPTPCDWCSISFSRSDKIRLIDAGPEVCHALPAKLGPEWVSKQSQYAPGIQEIKLHGYPWSTSGKETMRVRELLLTMLETLEEEGWTVYASIDQSTSGGQNTSETDTVILPERLSILKLTQHSGIAVDLEDGFEGRQCTTADNEPNVTGPLLIKLELGLCSKSATECVRTDATIGVRSDHLYSLDVHSFL